MANAWTIDGFDGSLSAGGQRPDDDCFAGGQPRLPNHLDLPTCILCGSEMAFFLQVAFPEGHAWHSRSLAVFHCTACFPGDFVIPELLEGPLKGVNVSSRFLVEYQRNFRLIVFASNEGVVRDDYEVRIKFARLKLREIRRPRSPESQVGGLPYWPEQDETPATIDGQRELVFLMQLQDKMHFPVLDSAPEQESVHHGFRHLNLRPSAPYYILFSTAYVYFFGPVEGEPLVYCTVQ